MIEDLSKILKRRVYYFLLFLGNRQSVKEKESDFPEYEQKIEELYPGSLSLKKTPLKGEPGFFFFLVVEIWPNYRK